MEKPAASSGTSRPGLVIRLFGQLTVCRNGVPVALPPSRKARVLLGYLATAPHPIGRSRLCQLLGDIPSDPKGELRWCLSKLRAVLDDPGHQRLTAGNDMIALELADSSVDACEIDKETRIGVDKLDAERLRHLDSLFIGEFLEGIELNRSPQLDHWLTTQRSRYHACQIEILDALINCLGDDLQEARRYAEKWVALTPFVPTAQIRLLQTLLRSGLLVEADHHLAAIIRLFETEKLETTSIKRAWEEMRGRQSRVPAQPLRAQPVDEEASSHGNPGRVSATPARASLAVMPFKEAGREATGIGLAGGLTHDIITRLAKLRSLFIIARGSVYALAEHGMAPQEAARQLDVGYFVSGVVTRRAGRVLILVELVETRTARIVWSQDYSIAPAGAFALLDEIGDRIVASIASEIELAEQKHALLKPPSSLSAWEAYHRGLWHMYRFTKADNDLAFDFFTQSSIADPTFSRAFSGISFTHWQNAFQNWADKEREADLAFEAAGRSVTSDDHDPAAHWALGRALWLRDRQDEAVNELAAAVELSPNFALGHYALAFVQCQSGDPSAAIQSADYSRALSPFDPLLFGMLGSRAMAHLRLGQYEDAAAWSIKAAARPNAHKIILAIAAYSLALAGRVDEGKIFAATIRRDQPGFGITDFLATFRFSPDTEALFRKGAQDVGLV